MDLRVLLRIWQRAPRDELLRLVTFTLEKMAAGGIYDQLGGGFHRYSVDERWLVPHFEKMLYDNALLAVCYVEAFQCTGRDDFARIARETLDFVLREMTSREGGFYCTQDADSEGEEGKFYVWTPGEIEATLGPDEAKAFCYIYDVSPEGNFEGRNILNLPKTLSQCARILDRDETELSAELASGRLKLLAVRGKRFRPGLDDKVLVSWNGLMIDALAQAAGVLGDARYLSAATAAAEFIVNNMRRGDGRLLHSWRAGSARFDAYLDDYGCLINALVSLYEADFDERWVDLAAELAAIVLDQFADSTVGGFFYTAADHEPLIARQKDVHDGSTPSGNAIVATALARLGTLCGESKYLTAAHQTLAAFAETLSRHPTAAGQFLIALDFILGPSLELVLAAQPNSEDATAVLSELRRRYLPNKIVVRRPGRSVSSRLDAVFVGKPIPPSGLALYVCREFSCETPAIGRDEALERIARLNLNLTGPVTR
jgi:uncharacterized protein YyaL (SSP411 family)